MHPSFKTIELVLFMFCWTSAQVIGQTKPLEEHSCAAARIKTTTVLLADGITSANHNFLMSQYDVHWYKLDLGLERNALDVSGQVTITATALVPLSKFAFELHPNLLVSSLKVNGVETSVQRQAGEAVAELGTALPKDAKFTVLITYGGRAPSGASAAIGNGLNTGIAQPWGSQVTWSLSEPFAAYEWFPVKQLLADKADSVTVWVTTDVTNKVGSNGLLQKVSPMPNQKHRYEWKSNYPIAYYLISVAVSDYQEYSFSVNLPGVPQPLLVQNYLYNPPTVLNSFKFQIDQTGPLLQTFSDLFGTYPFAKEKYGHSMAPIGGGMEHQTMTTQSTFTFTLTAHELAHQWWGDEVTCQDWSHIWLNEGFASYSEYLALQKLIPSDAKGWLNNAHQSAVNAPQGSVFVKDSTNVNRIFNSALSYKKGAFVLHMLRKAVKQDAVFFQILKEYRQEYKYKVADTRDFQRVAERVSGQNLQTFFDQWVYGEGVPIFDISWAQEGKDVVYKVAQSGSSPATAFFKTDVEYLISTDVTDTLVTFSQNKPTEIFKFKVRGAIQTIQVDPNQWLLDVFRSNQKDVNLLSELASNLVVYPNPTTGRLFLTEADGSWEEAVIIDVLGRNLRKVEISQGVIEVAGLRAGSYLLRLKKGDSYSFVRFVKI
ncbi:M1 family aminopeptidase [Rufibacter sp. DG15C]|uniref:M1 family aminopeptidase n=1 Tax=Rufibacter sp. DG15C TaxID=1379909 RepID=UPI00083230D9|nr:M1 family aminopeptidase [Rufibacter sp. DG15C]